MFKKKEEESRFKLNTNAKIFDIFYETKKIVYSTNKYNQYMCVSHQNKDVLPDIFTKKNYSPIPSGDNFIHLNKTSLTLSKDILFSHNSIKNIIYNNQNNDRNEKKKGQNSKMENEMSPPKENIINLKSRNNKSKFENKGSFYATSVNKMNNFSLNNQLYDNKTNDFYWDSKQELYFTLKRIGSDLQKETLYKLIEALYKNPSQNFSYSLTKTHNNLSSKTSITYLLKSFQIFFRNSNMNSSYSLKNLELYIPFSIIPLIYFLDQDNFISFLVYTTKFNEKFSEITFVYEKVYDYISTSIINIDKKDINLHNHYHNLKFDWLTPNILFEVSVRMPIVEIFYDSNNMKISKVMDIDIMLELYKTNFTSWDTLVINYLNQMKLFRQMINKSFSKFNQSNSKKVDGNSLDKNLDFNLIKDHYFNEKNIIFNFAYTDKKNSNKFVTLKSYNILIDYQERKLQVDLNFKQLKILERISENFKIDNFIKKLIIIDNKEPFISLDFEYFDHVDDNYFRFFRKSNLLSDSVHTSNIHVEVSKPFIQIREFENKISNLKEFSIGANVIKELTKRDITKWKHVFFENAEEMENLILDKIHLAARRRESIQREPITIRVEEVENHSQRSQARKIYTTKILQEALPRLSKK